MKRILLGILTVLAVATVSAAQQQQDVRIRGKVTVEPAVGPWMLRPLPDYSQIVNEAQRQRLEREKLELEIQARQLDIEAKKRELENAKKPSSAAPSSGNPGFMTSKDLKELCTTSDERSLGACLGYLKGIAEVAELEGLACPPPNAAMVGLHDAFVTRYFKENNSAMLAIAQGLASTHPCKKESTAQKPN